MPIKRYISEKDSTITDAFKASFRERATNANLGASDSLEIFSIYGQVTTNSLEKSRILIQFPIEQIKNDRNNGLIPQNGSVKFYLRMFNAVHPFSLPKDYSSKISVVTQDWDEGYGKDMETYTEYGWNNINKDGSGVTWLYNKSGSLWSLEGASTSSLNKHNKSFYFSEGTEDINLEITDIVEDWIDGFDNNGFLVSLSGSMEDGSQRRSFYTKKFFSKSTDNFYKKPHIEAKWETISTDDRDNFYASSSLAESSDNKMNIYFYNRINGKLKNIPGNVIPSIKVYSDEQKSTEITPDYLHISNPSYGIYKANICLNTTSSYGYDTWYNSSSMEQYFSNYFEIKTREGDINEEEQEYIVNIINNKLNYSNQETAKFKIFSRKKDWSPTIYTKSQNTIENEIIPDVYYKIFRLSDNYVVVDYSTGSIAYSKTSYNSEGNYFELDMSILEKNYTYGIKLARWNGIELQELPNTFKFKVE